jgi:hypothetical protein
MIDHENHLFACSAPNEFLEVTHRHTFGCQILARLARKISWAASEGDIEYP